MPRKPASLLCVANFPAGTGYAWDFLEGLYAAASDALSASGVRALVVFPSVSTVPRRLADSAAEVAPLQVELGSVRSVLELRRFIRRERVRALYLTDRPAWHPVYLLLRLSGVRRIVVYDHTSGGRMRPTGLRRWLKRVSRRLPGDDRGPGAGGERFVGLIPSEMVETVRNSIAIPPEDPHGRKWLVEELAVSSERPILACTARAARYKGVHILLEAFDRVLGERFAEGGRGRPLLVYVGDGPELENLKQLRDGLASRDDILLTGYRPDAARIAGNADLAIVPSVWQEAFGLAVLEPMAYGRPVVASAVGGIPEIVDNESTGLLGPPGDVGALAQAVAWMLEHPEEAREMGRRGRERARTYFDPETQLSRLVSALSEGFV